jgi:D-beta-D-heptose 7-phosphate kinase/D-beta-D-heptose 1-phosphate adenosyltransferase
MKKIWTNGCFDIIHVGHIELFRYAKSLGNQLIVGIDSDLRVKKLKGENRPINCEHDRKILLESIKYIDKVFIFDSQNDMRDILKSLAINTIVVGDDYKNKYVTGSELINNVIYFPKLPRYSTTSILNKNEKNLNNRS